MYSVTTTKATTSHTSIQSALLACANEPHASAAFGPTITNDAGESVSFDLIGGSSISVDDAQEIARFAGVDPRESDDDGMHWPYAPSVQEVADALAKFSN